MKTADPAGATFHDVASAFLRATGIIMKLPAGDRADRRLSQQGLLPQPSKPAVNVA
jgi:hypothetical protein